MATLLQSLNDALQSPIGRGPPAPPKVLAGLDDELAQLGQIFVAWGANGIDDWLTKFRRLFAKQAIRDSFLVRFLQLRFPRVAKLSQIQLSTGNNGPADWLDARDAVLDNTSFQTRSLSAPLQLRAQQLAEALTLAGLIDIEFGQLEPRAFAFRIARNRAGCLSKSAEETALFAILERAPAHLRRGWPTRQIRTSRPVTVVCGSGPRARGTQSR